MRKPVLLLAATAVALSSVGLAARSARYLDPREVAEAQRQHAELVEEFGGAETGARWAPRFRSIGSRGLRVSLHHAEFSG